MSSNGKIKNILGRICYYSGMARLLLEFIRSKLIIVTYHRITGQEENPRYFGLHQDIFEQQIVFLKKHFKIVPFCEGIGCFNSGSIKKPLLVLSFDDGYRDNYLYAFPLLKKHNITATIFLTTGFIETEKRFWWDVVADMITSSPNLKLGLNEKNNLAEDINALLKRMSVEQRRREIEKLKEKYGSNGNDRKEREILNWEEIREMSDYGIEFGSHTLTHPNLTFLSRDELKNEILKSKKILEESLGKKICGFAYPYGFYNNDAKRIVHEADYLYARSMINGSNSIGDDVFALKCVSGFVYTIEDFIVRMSCRAL